MNKNRLVRLCGSVLPAIVLVFPCIGAWGQTEKVLHNFGASGDGENPQASLVLTSNRNLFGTTYAGGTPSGCNGYTCGTVFELAPNPDGSWSESVIFNFDGVDGSNPDAPVIPDSQGNLFGVTLGQSGGTVFELTKSNGTWSEAWFHQFSGDPDGYFPAGTLVLDNAGRVYGTTTQGGVHNLGAAFVIDPQQQEEQIIYSFMQGASAQGGSDAQNGVNPNGSLLSDGRGGFYGTAGLGGSYDLGTVFHLTRTGGVWTARTLYSFKGNFHGAEDGSIPNGGVIADAAGNLYGETTQGGSQRRGIVFKLTPQLDGSWTESVLYQFLAGTDGQAPNGNLVFDGAGNLYGTTYSGGYGYGTVFELSPGQDGTWTETVLYRFSGGVDGSMPWGGVVRDMAGNLYGTTQRGGTYGQNGGVVFEITP